MDPPDVALPARLDGKIVAASSVVTPKEGFAGKTSYANSVMTKSGSTLPKLCQLDKPLIMLDRFLKKRPQIDRIRSSFKETIIIKGLAKIRVLDNFNIFIDFSNEEDFNLIWYKRVLTIDGQQMWLQKWSPDFKPEEDLSIAPV
ncbi:hypothetical protein P3S68_026108 [Capsicum galapagoense]